MTTPARCTYTAARRAPVRRRLLMALLFLPGLAQADVIPFHCVDLNEDAPEGLIAVRIGYVNDSGGTVSIPFGPENFFSPVPAFRGQITEFLPGVHEHGFTTLILNDGSSTFYSVDGVQRLLSLGVEDFCSGGISDLAIAPSGILFASTAEAGVYRSTDGGDSWHAINTGLDDLHVHALKLHPTDESILFAGTDDGVYKSLDGGDTWQAFNNGLPGTDTQP